MLFYGKKYWPRSSIVFVLFIFNRKKFFIQKTFLKKVRLSLFRLFSREKSFLLKKKFLKKVQLSLSRLCLIKGEKSQSCCFYGEKILAPSSSCSFLIEKSSCPVVFGVKITSSPVVHGERKKFVTIFPLMYGGGDL